MQGEPPILFDLFINDLLQDMQGVSVPDIEDTNSGLMFGDDAAILAGSKPKIFGPPISLE